MSGPVPARAGPVWRLAPRLVAALTLLLVGASACLRLASQQGPESFGRPPWLALPVALAALALALRCLQSADRLALARRLTLALLACALFGGAAVPALPGLVLGLAGVTLWLAAPWLRPGAMALAAAAVLAASVPAALTTRFPGGMVSWWVAVLPPLSLTLLVPSLLGGRRSRSGLAVVGLGAGLVGLAALSGYLDLAAQLPLPLSSLTATRLRPLGAHPNLAVPGLLTGLLACLALLVPERRGDGAPDAGGQADDQAPAGGAGDAARTDAAPGPSPGRPPEAVPGPADDDQPGTATPTWLAATLALAAALLLLSLLAVGSRTGALLSAGALGGWLVLGRLSLPWARLLPALVAVALLLPATGLADGSITRHSDSTVSKAVSFRSYMWQLGRAHLLEAPWTGHGARTQFLQGRHARTGRYDALPAEDHPHNLLLWVGGAFGWSGLAALVVLLLASFAHASRPGLLDRALVWALASAWLATAIDLGGATTTYVPGLALVLGSLLEARSRGGSGPAPTPGVSPAQAAWTTLGLVLVLVGLPRAWGLAGLLDAADRLQQAEPPSATEARALAAELASRRWTLPGDHRPDLLRGRLLALDPAARPEAPRLPGAPRTPGALEALEQALERAPDLPDLLHAVALMRSRRDPDDPTIGPLLERALELGSAGPDAGRLLLDQALLAGHRGQADQARTRLLAALPLDPGLVTRVPRQAGTGALLLGLDGRQGLPVSLDELLDQLEARARDRQDDDPAYALRLDLAIPQVAAAAGEPALTERWLEALAARHPAAARRQRARFLLDAGDHDGALAVLRALGDLGGFQLVAETLLAAAHAETLDPDLCQDLWERAQQLLPDVLFEQGNLATLLRGRLRWAERVGDRQAQDAARRALDWLGA